MKQRDRQSGFGTMVILLAVLVVAVIAASGVVLYQHHKPSSTKNNAATSTTQTGTQPQNTTTTQPAQTTTQYFTINEWGVRAPYTGQDTFTYTLSADKTRATIISKQLASKDPGCATGGAGAIARLSPSDYPSPYKTGPTIEQDATQHPALYTHIGGYYYLFEHAQSECGSISISDQNQANDAVKALVANFQAIPTN